MLRLTEIYISFTCPYPARQHSISIHFQLYKAFFLFICNLNVSQTLRCDALTCLQKANNKVRQISGYIVYAAECRKDIQAEYPGQTFGDISRIVGNKVGLYQFAYRAKWCHNEYSLLPECRYYNLCCGIAIYNTFGLSSLHVIENDWHLVWGFIPSLSEQLTFVHWFNRASVNLKLVVTLMTSWTCRVAEVCVEYYCSSHRLIWFSKAV